MNATGFFIGGVILLVWGILTAKATGHWIFAITRETEDGKNYITLNSNKPMLFSIGFFIIAWLIR